MQFDRYANLAAILAADLVNLHADGARPAAPVVADALAEHGLYLEVGTGDLEEIASLAADLRGVFAADGLDAALERLNALLADTVTAPRVVVHDDRGPHLHVEPETASTPVRLRANCLMGLAAVLCDGGRYRLGVCDADDCDTVYVDTSRNARRRFCSDTCGTRTHVAAHRARRARA